MTTRIGLYNLEPRFTNIALEKIRRYYEAKGCVVSDCSPVEASEFDQVYCSSLFDWTPKKYVAPNMVVGGTGFDPTIALPPDIEATELHINRGFTTRGCIRNCPFCLVRVKEGYIRVVGTLLDLWDKVHRDIVLYDNNILALPEHFHLICEQARQYKLHLDFNQGLDHRLLTPELIAEMKSISHVEYRFSFDQVGSADTVVEAIRVLRENGIQRSMWFVLTGFNTTIQDDLFRLNLLRNEDQDAYVQRYRRPNFKKDARELVALARWANQHNLFRKLTWRQFLQHPDNNYEELMWTADIGKA